MCKYWDGEQTMQQYWSIEKKCPGTQFYIYWPPLPRELSLRYRHKIKVNIKLHNSSPVAPTSPACPGNPGNPGFPGCPVWPWGPRPPNKPVSPVAPGDPDGPDGPWKPLGPWPPDAPAHAQSNQHSNDPYTAGMWCRCSEYRISKKSSALSSQQCAKSGVREGRTPSKVRLTAAHL